MLTNKLKNDLTMLSKMLLYVLLPLGIIFPFIKNAKKRLNVIFTFTACPWLKLYLESLT